jgi:2-polyprenyl-3-methyl-5-hydroxy-6-metoxy-1,4-benzoquinol methylase
LLRGTERLKDSGKFWDRFAKYSARQEEKIQLTDNRDYVSALKHLNVDDVVLEYGCGTGLLSNAIADGVKEIQAIDISAKMIEVAKSKARERRVENVTYTQTGIFDQRFRTESFNVILAFNVLHVLEDAQDSVQRIGELLVPGGLLISATPCLGQKSKSVFWRILLFPLRIVLFLAGKVRIVPRIRFLKISEMDGLMASGGLQIVETEILSESPPHYFIAARKL